MEGAKRLRGLGRDRPRHDASGCLDHRDRQAPAGADRGEFEPDEARAHHHDPAGALDGGAQGVGVVEGAELAHAREFGARHRQGPVAGAGGEDEMVVRETFAIREAHLPLLAVDPRHAGLGAVADRVVGKEALLPQEEAAGIGLASEVGLRQRRALIGQHRLLADQGEASGKARLPQRGRGLEAGLARTDDDDVVDAHGPASAGLRADLPATPSEPLTGKPPGILGRKRLPSRTR